MVKIKTIHRYRMEVIYFPYLNEHHRNIMILYHHVVIISHSFQLVNISIPRIQVFPP